MSEKPRLWCLYYKPEDRMMRGLTTEEVRAVATSLSHMEKIHWLVWKEYWDLWKSLPDVDELMNPLSRPVDAKVPSVTTQQSLEDFEEPRSVSGLKPLTSQQTHNMTKRIGDITLPDVTVDMELEIFKSSRPGFEDLKSFKARNFMRYSKQLLVQILGPAGKRFESKTVDISVGGMKLADPLPGWAAGSLQLRLVDRQKKQAIEVTCMALDETWLGKRFRLGILPLKRKSEELQFDRWLAV